MNLICKEDIENEVFSITLQFDSYGSLGLSPEEEASLLNDFPVNLVYSDISFSGKYGLDADGNVVVDDLTGDTVSLIIPNKKILLDSNFKIIYSISKSQITTNELGEKLTTPEKVCIAKCRLFQKAVIAQVTTLLTSVRGKITDFASSTTPITITI